MDSSTFQLKVFLFLLTERFSENFAHELLQEDKQGYYRRAQGGTWHPTNTCLAARKGPGPLS